MTPFAPNQSELDKLKALRSPVAHTPGRWFAAESDDGYYWTVRYAPTDRTNGFLSAEIGRVTSANTGHEEANARLMAAAPEHHEASLSTVDRLADLPRFLRKENNRALAEIVEEEIAKHRAAIAKATGEAA